MTKFYQNFNQRKKYLFITWFLFTIILIFIPNKSKYEVSIPLLTPSDLYFANYKDSDFNFLFNNENIDRSYGPAQDPINPLNPLEFKDLILDINFLNTTNINLIKEELKVLEFKFYYTFKIMPGTGKVSFSANLRLINNEEINKEKIINILNIITNNIQNTIKELRISQYNKLIIQTKNELENSNNKINSYVNIIKLEDKFNQNILENFIETKSRVEILNKKINQLNKELDIVKNINKRFNLFNLNDQTAVKKFAGANISLIYLIIFTIFFCLNFFIISINRNFLNFSNKIF